MIASFSMIKKIKVAAEVADVNVVMLAVIGLIVGFIIGFLGAGGGF
jgi:uncharacterized membrane protein YfcA